jgi:hypothetical protein
MKFTVTKFPKFPEQKSFVLPVERERRQFALKCIEEWRLAYLQTKDSELAKRVLSIARHVDLPLPEWALEDPEIANLQNGARAFIGTMQRLFLATGNQMYLFKACRASRGAWMTPPEWVLRYFHTGANDFLEAGDRFVRGNRKGRNDPIRAFAKAFGIVRGRGHTIWDQYEPSLPRWLFLGADVAEAVAHRPRGKKCYENAALDKAAASPGFDGVRRSRATLRRQLRLFRHIPNTSNPKQCAMRPARSWSPSWNPYPPPARQLRAFSAQRRCSEKRSC